MQFADDALLGYPPLEEQNLGQKLSQNLEVGPSLIGLPEKKMRPLPLGKDFKKRNSAFGKIFIARTRPVFHIFEGGLAVGTTLNNV